MARRDVRLADLLRTEIDGVPLELAAQLLPWRSRLNFGLLSHVHLHARSQKRHAADADDGKAARSARIPRNRLSALIGNLRSTVKGLDWTPAGTEWADYADHTSYGDAATADKARLVGEFVGRVPGPRAWDLGANTGRYSRIAPTPASACSPSTSTRPPPSSTTGPSSGEQRSDILPLVLDLANPSPGLGWASRERRSLLERADADVVLALALIHHLAISRNVPLPMILGLFADLAPSAIVEFVPKEDPMVRHLLASRKDVFPDYDLEGFRAAAADRFEVVSEQPIQESPRVLFLLRRR